LQANVNNVTWTPDTLGANITYSAAKKTKVFSFTGTYLQQRLTCAVTLSNATNTNDFTLSSYTIDATGNPMMTYSSLQKGGTGAYVFVPLATAGLNEGNITITSINTVTGLISGSFNFTTKKANYDSSGNITSVTNIVVLGGYFTDMPYTFVSN